MTDKLYTKTHEWLKEEGDTTCVGITNHAQELLGDLVFVELPEIGAVFSAGDELGVVESVKAASDFYAPVDGEVVAVNEALNDDPSLVNTDAENDGWLVRIKPHSADRTHLLNKEAYLALLEE